MGAVFTSVFRIQKLSSLSGKEKEETLQEVRNKEGDGIHTIRKEKGVFTDGEKRTN